MTNVTMLQKYLGGLLLNALALAKDMRNSHQWKHEELNIGVKSFYLDIVMSWLFFMV